MDVSTVNGNLQDQSSLFSLLDDVSIIVGTPFLYIHSIKALVLGDLHFGQEAVLVDSERSSTTHISLACKQLRSEVEITLEKLDIQRVIFNGDIKHKTEGINQQEVTEIAYFFSSELIQQHECILIRGNHDKLLKMASRGSLPSRSQVVDQYKSSKILFHHGHQNVIDDGVQIIVLSHEHPAYRMRGFNGNHTKLRAFVTLQTKTGKTVVLLPASSEIALGMNFPPFSTEGFLSPYLQSNADMSTIQIFPFDKTVGLLPLPPVKDWKLH
ncbi:MAG: metallophosphoesterase [Candidatus Kariarchaeaceae archaeon]|jgi:putative SbcD/Mre11-related phosphoesterase